MTHPLNRRLVLAAIAAAAGCAVLPVAAQSGWPNKPVKIVVPFPAGGTTDILARAIAPELSKAFGQQFIVDNRGGAGGNVGSDIVAKSAPDGYTLLMGTVGTHGINRALYSKLSFDPIKDFRSVGLIATSPYAIVANPKVPGSNLKEMLALAKTQGRNSAMVYDPQLASKGRVRLDLDTALHKALERGELEGRVMTSLRYSRRILQDRGRAVPAVQHDVVGTEGREQDLERAGHIGHDH